MLILRVNGEYFRRRKWFHVSPDKSRSPPCTPGANVDHVAWTRGEAHPHGSARVLLFPRSHWLQVLHRTPVGSAKRRGRGPRQKRNSQDGKTHPCHHNVFTVQEDTFQSAPPSLEHRGVSCLGTGPPPLQDADSQNAAVAPVWCRQSLSTDVPATTSQGGSDGLQKPPWTWTCTHKASLPDLCQPP